MAYVKRVMCLVRKVNFRPPNKMLKYRADGQHSTLKLLSNTDFVKYYNYNWIIWLLGMNCES